MNPLLPGFHPDPSIVLVDGVYYAVTSTFEYLPGLPVHRSTDLETWEVVGHVATRPEQVELADVPTPGGAWAPTIRHHDGLFHVIVTVMLGGRGCVVFTAEDPAGPWSDGVEIPAVTGIDPDLAWDEDGTALVTFADFPHAIGQIAVDLATGQALEEPRRLWPGTGLMSPEGPHLHQRDGSWYLLVAEGGTDRGHAVTVTRGPSPRGPWEPGRRVVTAAGSHAPIQNTGHADLVETPTRDTALVLLGVRPLGLAGAFSPLGRETFLTPVTWSDGWPTAPVPVLAPGPGVVESFALTAMADAGWLAVRRTPEEVAKPSPNGLVLFGDGSTLDDPRPVFLGRRQRHLASTTSVTVDASAGAGGLCARHDEEHWFALTVTGETVTATARLSGLAQQWTATVPPGPVRLTIETTPPGSDFVTGSVGGDTIRLLAGQTVLAELDGRYWSFEVAKSFTGRVTGMFATDGTVTFSDLNYRGDDS